MTNLRDQGLRYILDTNYGQQAVIVLADRDDGDGTRWPVTIGAVEGDMVNLTDLDTIGEGAIVPFADIVSVVLY